MRRILLFVMALALAASCRKDEVRPEDIALQAAKVYYDQLLRGDYDAYVDGTLHGDSVPPAYRRQLVLNMQMFRGAPAEGAQGHRVRDAPKGRGRQHAELRQRLPYRRIRRQRAGGDCRAHGGEGRRVVSQMNVSEAEIGCTNHCNLCVFVKNKIPLSKKVRKSLDIRKKIINFVLSLCNGRDVRVACRPLPYGEKPPADDRRTLGTETLKHTLLIYC